MILSILAVINIYVLSSKVVWFKLSGVEMVVRCVFESNGLISIKDFLKVFWF